MHLVAKAIRLSQAKFRCNRLTCTTVQDIQDYMSLIFFGTQCIYILLNHRLQCALLISPSCPCDIFHS